MAATTLPRKNGQLLSVILLFRGKHYNIQLFFPTLKVPNKSEVMKAVQKVYPNARVTYYSLSNVDPTQPLLRVD